MLESLISETQSMRLVKGEKYMYIKSSYLNKIFSDEQVNYNSRLNPLSKEELKDYALILEVRGKMNSLVVVENVGQVVKGVISKRKRCNSKK